METREVVFQKEELVIGPQGLGLEEDDWGKEGSEIREQLESFSEIDTTTDHGRKVKEAREKMWLMVGEFLDEVKDFDGDVDQLKERVKAFFVLKNDYAKKIASEGWEEKVDSLPFHLKEVEEFGRRLLFDGSKSRFGEVLSDRHARLLVEVVAPFHDIFKFFGSVDAQIMRDHEVVGAKLMERMLKKTKLNGDSDYLSEEDIRFVVGVIGDHENIYKEEGRREMIHSKDPVERAKGIFFVMDVLTNCFVVEELAQGRVVLDEEKLKARFSDLYYRHVDKVRGKTFRPEWGLYAIGDLFEVFEVMENRGLIFDEGVREKIINQAKKALKQAIMDNRERESKGIFDPVDRSQKVNPMELRKRGMRLNGDERRRIEMARKGLNEILIGRKK